MDVSRSKYISESTFYYPVRKRGNRFVELKPDTNLLRPAAEIEMQLHEKYKLQEAIVEIAGGVFSASVWVPNSGKGHAYVAVDSDRRPAQRDSFLAIDDNDVAVLKDSLRRIVSRGEFGSSEDSVSLETQFIPPTFNLATSQSEAAGEEVEWNEITNFARAVITGDPGAGKTSCLRRITLDAIERLDCGDPNSPIPIYFALRRLRDGQLSIASVARVIANFGAGRLATMTADLAATGQLLLILDGLDEVPDDTRNDVIVGLEALAALYPRLRMVLSARTAGFSGTLSDFAHLRIQEWSLSQISRYSCYRLPSLNTARQFLSAMRGTEGVSELVSNPLMLTIATELYAKFSTLPTRRTTLLEACVDNLISQWDARRNVVRRRDEWASPHRKLNFLTELAFHSCNETRDAFDRTRIISWMPSAEDRADIFDLLEVSQEHTGLLVQVSQHEWSFTHRAIQEFLAAKYLVSSLNDFGNVAPRLTTSPRWQEIWRYSCSLSSEPRRLIDDLLTNQVLGDDVRICLLSSALAENIEIDQESAKRCCLQIVKAVEKRMLKCSIVEERAIDESPIVWMLKFAVNDDDPSLSVDLLRRTMRLLFSARASIWRNDLIVAFSRSKQSLTKQIGRGLSAEGTLRTPANDLAPVITLEVVRELPALHEYGG